MSFIVHASLCVLAYVRVPTEQCERRRPPDATASIPVWHRLARGVAGWWEASGGMQTRALGALHRVRQLAHPWHGRLRTLKPRQDRDNPESLPSGRRKPSRVLCWIDHRCGDGGVDSWIMSRVDRRIPLTAFRRLRIEEYARRITVTALFPPIG